MPNIFDEIENGNTNFIKEFIDNGGDVDTLNSDGESLLFTAIIYERLYIIRLLIENGADINFINEVGMHRNVFDPCCPLGVAVNMQNIEIARMLIENGANVDPSQFFEGITGEASEEQIKDFREYSIINDLFCQNMVYSRTPDDFEMYLLLINNGINLHLGNTRPPNVIFSAISHFDGEAERIIENIFHMGTLNINEVINGRHLCDFYDICGYELARFTPGILNIFFSRGVDINLRNNEGNTLLHFAATDGNSEIVTALLSAGADHTIINDDRDTPLYVAIKHGNIEAIEALLRANPDSINLTDDNGDTPLHIAAYYENIKVIEVLLSANPDNINVRNEEGDTPLDIALAENNVDIAQAFLRAGRDIALDNELQESNFNKRKSANDSNEEANAAKRIRYDEGQIKEDSDNTTMEIDEQNDEVFYPDISQASANSVSHDQDEIELLNSFGGFNWEHTYAAPAALEVNVTTDETRAFDSFVLFDYNYYSF